MTRPGDIEPRVMLAHAKVNLFLAVGGRRADGYHDVTTVLQALELSDEVEVRPGGAGTTLLREDDLGIPPEEDLAYKSVEAWRALTGRDDGVTVAVRKRIPAGAGLGGGSADAAAVLCALAGRMGPDGPIPPGLLSAAAGLGADVPFFLGPGTRVMTGRGDTPGEALPTPTLHVVLVNPGVPVATLDAYAQFDRMLVPPPAGPEAMIAAVLEGGPESIAAALYNNMTPASCALVPEIAGALRFLEGCDGLLGSAMAGSGSTVFGVFEDAGRAASAALAARERGWWAEATRSAASGVEATAL